MADAKAAGRAREAAVGDERHLVAHALAVERSRGREHLAHAGAAFGALVADDEHLALLVALGAHRGEGILLAIEAAGRPAELKPLHAGDLDDGAVRRERALEADDASRGRERLVSGTHHVLIRITLNFGEILIPGPTGDSHAVAKQIAMIEEGFQQERDAT